MDKYIGKRLDGRYEIKEIIGVGGMAYVYKAYDTIDDRIVAVKILKDEYLANEEFTRRFKNESKAIAILSNTNIVKVYDVSFSDRLQYIVMEYIDGITLKEYIDQQHDIKWKEAVHFTVQILRALQHAHDKGIVHRDIKPQNIMLLPDGTIKVTDFGIARFSRQDVRATSATDKAIGSVHYISPEQARGEITDEKSDVYSVGVMLYEMLTGRLPFEADNAVSVAIMQLQSEPKMPREINPSIPEGLEEITIKAMQKDPSKRYQTAAEMLYDIEEFKRNPSIHFEYKYFVDETPTKFVEAITKVKGEHPAEDTGELVQVEEEDEEEKKGPPVIPILLAIAGAFVLVAVVFVVIVVVKNFIDPDTEAKEEVVVPTFIGMNYYEDIANNQEYLANFDFATPKEQYDDSAAGTVLEQSEDPGKTMKVKQRPITLTISKGPNMKQIPDVRNQHQDVAAQMLKSEGFEVSYSQMSSDEVQKDFVIKSQPGYPESAAVGSTIILVVSNGPEPVEDEQIPNVKGVAQDEAVRQLTEKGFVVNTSNIEVQNHPSYPAGTVISQSPEADTMAQPGTEVKLVVSSGYRDLTINMPLPTHVDFPVDLEVYIDGVKSSSFTGLSGILPNVKRSMDFTLTEKKSSYRFSVMISRSGENNFQSYADYQVNGTTGTAVMLSLEEDIYKSETTTAPITSPTNDRNVPNRDD